METLKVSSKSNPNSVAGAMAGVVRADGEVVVQVVGAGALNQAVKAIAIARGYVSASGIDLVCVPTFAEVEIDGEPRTAIRLAIHDRLVGITPSGEAAAPAAPVAAAPVPAAPVEVAAGPQEADLATGARALPIRPAVASGPRPRIGDTRPAPSVGPAKGAEHPRATA